LIKYLDNKAYHYYNEFSIVNCNEITSTYKPDVLQQEAGYYYKRRSNKIDGLDLNTNSKPPRLDMVSCFCNAKGYTNIYNAVVGKDVKYKYTDPETGKVEHLPICRNYEKAMKDSLWYGKIICTKSIVIINIIIRITIIYVMKKVGYKTNQDMFLSITRAVFLA
jgi:hypothetical protein